MRSLAWTPPGSRASGSAQARALTAGARVAADSYRDTPGSPWESRFDVRNHERWDGDGVRAAAERRASEVQRAPPGAKRRPRTSGRSFEPQQRDQRSIIGQPRASLAVIVRWPQGFADRLERKNFLPHE
jgi:hypothetical protein